MSCVSRIQIHVEISCYPVSYRFKHYFLPDNPEKPNAIFKFLNDIVLGPGHEDDSKMVPNMFKSILSGGVSGDKTPHKIHNVCLTKQDFRCEKTQVQSLIMPMSICY